MTIPTVGRIVNYTNLGDKDGKYPPEQQAAIVTKVVQPMNESVMSESDVKVSLTIFYPTGTFMMADVPYSQEYKRGHWSWMPYQKAQAAK